MARRKHWRYGSGEWRDELGMVGINGDRQNGGNGGGGKQ